MMYENEKGELVDAVPGLGHEVWIAARINGNARHRIVSPNLPLCKTQEECQAYLDAYAKKKKWEKYDKR